MARRSDHSKEELMELVIQAALELIEEHQTVRITARQIASRIGYTPGTLYTHFANLDEIFFHVNARSLRQLRLGLEQVCEDDTQPVADVLVAMGLAYLDFAREHRYRFQAMFTPRLPESVTPPAYLQTEIDALFDLLGSQLTRLGTVDQDTLDEGARALWSGVHGVASLSIADQLFTPRPRLERRIVERLVRQFAASWPPVD